MKTKKEIEDIIKKAWENDKIQKQKCLSCYYNFTIETCILTNKIGCENKGVY